MFNRWPKVTNSWRSFPARAGFQAGAWADPVRSRSYNSTNHPAQEQISSYTSIFSVNLCHMPTLGHYPGKLHRLFWNMSIPPAPKLQSGYRFENIWSHFRLIYDCQIEKVFESPTGLEQGTSCPLDMPWLPLPGCAGDQNNLSFRWLHRTRTICK